MTLSGYVTQRDIQSRDYLISHVVSCDTIEFQVLSSMTRSSWTVTGNHCILMFSRCPIVPSLEIRLACNLTSQLFGIFTIVFVM